MSVTKPSSSRRRQLLQAALPAACMALPGCSQTGRGNTAPEPLAPPVAVELPEPLDSADHSGHVLAAEFDPVAAVWLSFGAGHEEMTLGLLEALHAQVPLKFLVPDAAAEAALRELLRQRRLPRGQGRAPLQFIQEPLASFFVRDVAVFTRGARGADGSGLGVVDFRWTEYGMPAWCTARHPGNAAMARSCAAGLDYAREQLDRAVARHAGARIFRSSVAIEGGGVETNGRGLLIANRALYATRNPGRSLAEVEALLLRLPGIRRVIWLPEGLAEDPHLRASIDAAHVAWGTGGHTDEFVRFADARTVLLAWPEDSDVATHPVSRLTRQRMQRNFEILSRSSDADGRPLRVLRVPMPRPVQRRIFLSAGAETAHSREWSADFFAPSERRWQGQPLLQLATTSYLNHVVANGVVVLPDYLPHGTPPALQERVRRVYEQAFPGRQIRFVDAISANWVGGGLHCATLSEPAVPD
jgi:agmatine deiminase